MHMTRAASLLASELLPQTALELICRILQLFSRRVTNEHPERSQNATESVPGSAQYVFMSYKGCVLITPRGSPFA
jgi:hypothetical protein